MTKRDRMRRGEWRKAWSSPLAIGIASLLWFLLRTGTKPSRAAYPCQRAALANASALLGTLALPALLGAPAKLTGGGAGPARSNALRFVLFLVGALAAVGVVPRAARLLTGAGSRPVAQAVTLRLAEHHLPFSTFSDIYAVQGTTGTDAGFRRLLELMERRGRSFYSLVGARDVVIIKVNSQWDQRAGTNTDLVRQIIESILEHPDGFAGEIVIADNGQGQYGAAGRGGSLDWQSNNAADTSQSMQDVANLFSGRHKVSTALWDRITTKQVGEYAQGDLRDGYVVASSASPRTGVILSRIPSSRPATEPSSASRRVSGTPVQAPTTPSA